MNKKQLSQHIDFPACGCYQKDRAREANTIHGFVRTKEYETWVNMRTRCYNKNSLDYKNYGNRGIKVCKRWKDSFKNFLEDMGRKPKDMTLDRINNDGNYELSNCRWATRSEQALNRRAY